MIVLFFINGLIIGSFLNVCIYRIPEGKSVIYPPSSCGSCGHKLNFIDMIPVLNYILYKGRCRYCNSYYSLQYPTVELLNGVLYFFTAYRYGFTIYTVALCLLISLLIVAGVIDIKYMIIPDSINILIFLLGLLLIIYDGMNVKDKLIGLGFGLLLFLMIALVTKSMGGGDIKLMAAIGFVFGLKGVLFVSIFSFVIGAIVSVILLFKGMKSRKDKIPFGPFISLAAGVYIFFGNEIISSYFNWFGF